jgi:hypothetical protein
MTTDEKIDFVLGHINKVQQNCYKVGKKLIKSGEIELGRNLIANGQIHDNSKFKGIEFDHIIENSPEKNDPLKKDAISHHNKTNPHHPEYWGSIHNMPDVYIAEMVCDCAARSAEFGTDLRLWFKEDASKRYSFVMEDEAGEKIERFLNLLLERPFSSRL